MTIITLPQCQGVSLNKLSLYRVEEQRSHVFLGHLYTGWLKKNWVPSRMGATAWYRNLLKHKASQKLGDLKLWSICNNFWKSHRLQYLFLFQTCVVIHVLAAQWSYRSSGTCSRKLAAPCSHDFLAHPQELFTARFALEPHDAMVAFAGLFCDVWLGNMRPREGQTRARFFEQVGDSGFWVVGCPGWCWWWW